MSRKLSKILLAAVALCWLVGGSMLHLRNNARLGIESSILTRVSTAGSPVSTAFAAPDDVHTSVPGALERMYVPEFLAMSAFERHFTGENALPPREYVPVRMTAALDFDRAFRAVSLATRDNTPPNRDRLRTIGWRHILIAGSNPNS